MSVLDSIKKCNHCKQEFHLRDMSAFRYNSKTVYLCESCFNEYNTLQDLFLFPVSQALGSTRVSEGELVCDILPFHCVSKDKIVGVDFGEDNVTVSVSLECTKAGRIQCSTPNVCARPKSMNSENKGE